MPRITNSKLGLRTFLPINIPRKNQVYLRLKSLALDYKAGKATICAATLTTARADPDIFRGESH